MSDMSDRDKKGAAHENLLEILDNVIHQLDFTGKMVIIMIVSFITIIPVTAVVINALSDNRDLQAITGYVAIAIFVIWLGVGIRQWIVFSRWKSKYRLYKELQKKLEESLDFEKDKGQP
jgi:ABC-type glycerol-3-phosphate transport system permease component